MDRDAPRRDARRDRGEAPRAARAPLPGRSRAASDARRTGRQCRCRTPTSSRSTARSSAYEDVLPAGFGHARSTSGSPGRARVTAASTCRGARRSSRSSHDAGHAPGDLLRVQPGGLRPERAVAAASRASGSRRARRPTGSGTGAETRAAWIDEADLVTLGFYEFLDGLTAGIAAHHAGMLPVFKETVEELFEAGLVKVVFATETLSLGHQHAGQDGRDRGPVEVPGRAARAAHPGRVHAAHRARRAARDRRARARRRRLPAPGAVRTRGGARRHPDLRPHLVVPALVQHGGQPRAQLHAASRRTTC